MIIIAVGVALLFYSISGYLPLNPPASSPFPSSQPSPTPTTTPRPTPSLPPALTHLHSFQWAGYVVASDFRNQTPVVSGISGSWKVPEVAVSVNDTYSGAWIGIGGYPDKTLIQTGTEHQFVNGRSRYFAWYELVPNFAITIRSVVILPGDTITDRNQPHR